MTKKILRGSIFQAVVLFFTYFRHSLRLRSDSLRLKLEAAAAILSFFFCSFDRPPWKLWDLWDLFWADFSEVSFKLTELARLSLILFSLLVSFEFEFELWWSLMSLDLLRFRKSLAAFSRNLVDSRLSTGFLWLDLSSFDLK